ncbi:STAS domain-containing protein [Nannocystis radixulma]|uniref:STAS domain-containing protein n=1 Tax=Nannocystis radixulma TaxID=2995305 RepID=A0ABT5BNP3_9BACT|nr:STAS domain-containing protein [Nannocystis radixulma]MDC0675797.1 STAS domain-containing protein [Nannocystis radixulma]
MKLTRTDHDDETTIQLSGALDGNSAPAFHQLADTLIAEGRHHITLDMSGLDQIDSPGVAAIIGLHKRTREAGGDVRIAGIRDHPLAIFKLLRFDKVFDL